MRRLNLFLIELVFCIVLFTVSAAVCVGLTVRAKQMSAQSEQLTTAVQLAQQTAERWRAGEELPAAWTTDGYEVRLSETDDAAPLRSCDIAVSRGGETIYALEGVAAA